MSVALSLTDRQLLIASAPEGLGDHVVSFASGTIFALVRKDSTTPNGRIVAMAHSAEELQNKLCPPANAVPAPKPAGSPWRRRGATAAQPVDAAQQRTAQNELRNELAEYRRACAAAGVESKLI